MTQSTTGNPIEDVKRAGAALRQDASNGLHAAETAIKRGVAHTKADLAEVYDNAAQHVDEAREFLKRSGNDRPLATAAAAVGVGLILGLLLAGGRNR